MLRSLWTAKTGLDAQQTSLDTISNNLANVSTTAYKRVRPIFEDLLYQNLRSPGFQENSFPAGSGDNIGVANQAGLPSDNFLPAGLQAGNGSRVSATQRINSPGSLIQSQNPLDLAINGNGFFVVQTGNGPAFTRSGNFMRNQLGQMVTSGGNVLLGYPPNTVVNASSPPPFFPITIPSFASDIVIGSDGGVSYSSGPNSPIIPAGIIPLVNFANPNGLTSAGGGLYFDTPSSGVQVPGLSGSPGFGAVSQYYTEQSNVNVAEELVSLISAQRAYEITAKSVSASDQILQKLGQL